MFVLYRYWFVTCTVTHKKTGPCIHQTSYTHIPIQKGDTGQATHNKMILSHQPSAFQFRAPFVVIWRIHIDRVLNPEHYTIIPVVH